MTIRTQSWAVQLTLAATLGLAGALAGALTGCTINVGAPAVERSSQLATPPAPRSGESTRQKAPRASQAATHEATEKSTQAAPEPSRESTREPGPRLNFGTARTAPNADLPWIVQGDRGNGARCVQHALNIISDAQLSVDGYYGPVSRQALAAFQRSIGIRADGEVGPATGRWLASYYDSIEGAGAWARTGCYGYVPARRG